MTLDLIAEAGYIDSILYTDLCNEWPGDDWAPLVKPHMTYGDWDKPASLEYMHKTIALVRAKYPEMPLLFSCAAGQPMAAVHILRAAGAIRRETTYSQSPATNSHAR